jgi:hypothetical protein
MRAKSMIGSRRVGLAQMADAVRPTPCTSRRRLGTRPRAFDMWNPRVVCAGG